MSGLKWENVFCWLFYQLLTLGERDRGSRIMNLALSNANGHITLNTPVLVRSLKLSNVESSQYLDGWPPGNTGCCWLLTFYSFLANFSVKESLSKFLEPLVILLVSCNLLPKRILKTKKIGFPDHFENSWKFLWGEKSRFLSQFWPLFLWKNLWICSINLADLPTYQDFRDFVLSNWTLAKISKVFVDQFFVRD